MAAKSVIYNNTIPATIMQLPVIEQHARKNAGRISLITAIFLLVNACINYWFDLMYSFYAVLVTGLVLLINLLYIHRRWPLTGRYLLLAASLLCVVVLNYAEGRITGSYLYLFLYLIIANFIFSYREKVHIIIAYITLLAALVAIFGYLPVHSAVQFITPADEDFNFKINLYASFIFGSLLVIRLLKLNHDNLTDMEEQGQLLHTIYHSSLDAVFIIDAESNLISGCNENALQLFLFPDSDSVTGQSMSALFANPVMLAQNNPELYAPATSWRGEADCIMHDSTVFPGYLSMVSFVNKDRHYKKISIFDISSIRKIQDQLIEAKEKAEDAARAKSRFLSNMSHELRTPLNGIIGTANLLLQEQDLPEALNKHFTLLRYSSEHMLGLVNDVLDFSKIEAGKMQLTREVFNLDGLLQRLCLMLKPQFEVKNVAFSCEVDPLLNRNFTGDMLRINQVLSNIISNACKFTASGTVTVRVSQQRRLNDHTTVYFEVADTGIGIPDDKLAMIFESFSQGDNATTRKYGGTGLGLAISKRIVALHSGSLQVKNNPSGGCCFYFTLNLTNAAPAAAADTYDYVLTPLEGLRLLIAEDNAVNMMIAVRFLEKWKATVVQAANGKEAMTLFKQQPFDIVVADLEMPEMDGYQLLNAIRRIDNNIPVIAFTAAVYEDMIADLHQKGFTDYIQKPFRPEELHRKLLTNTNHLSVVNTI